MAHPVKSLFSKPIEVGLQKGKGRLLHLFSAHPGIDTNVAKRPVESVQMVGQPEEATVKAGSNLIHSIPPQESPIERRDSRLLLF
jgi:hypothetical protein